MPISAYKHTETVVSAAVGSLNILCNHITLIARLDRSANLAELKVSTVSELES